MREFHKISTPSSKNAVLWQRIRKFMIKAKGLCSQEHTKEFHLDILENEIDTLEKELSQNHQNVPFCHNDLQYGNIMIDDTRAVTVIQSKSHNATYGVVKIMVSGHSMGGSMSAFCGLDIVLMYGSKNVQLMTFGMPQIGVDL